MSEDLPRIKQVESEDKMICVVFEDDLEGEISINELDLPAPLKEIDQEHLKSTKGLEVRFIYETGSSEVFPSDYFRYKLDDNYQKKTRSNQEQELKKLGRKIKELRKARDLSQQELARRAGIGRVTLSRLENGKQSPRFQTVTAIAGTLDITLQKLIIPGDETAAA